MVRLPLLFLRWKIEMRSYLQRVWRIHVPHEKIRKIFGWELLSFGCLSGVAMGLLTFHRFQASTILFSIAVGVVAAQLLLRIFAVNSPFVKFFCILFVYVLAVGGTTYLVGVVKQEEEEYYASKIMADASASRQAKGG